MPPTSIMPPPSPARWAGVIEEATREGSGLNPSLKGLNVSRTGAPGDRQIDHVLGLSSLFSREGQNPVGSAGPQVLV